MAAEVTSVTEHADVLQYLLTGAVIVIAALIKRDSGNTAKDVKRIEQRGDMAMTAIFGSPAEPKSGLQTRMAVVEERCKITHGDHEGTPHRRSTDGTLYQGNGRIT